MDNLIQMLKDRGVNVDSAVNICAMVMDGSRKDRLMQWINQNPEATAKEICTTARAIGMEK